MVQRQNVLIAIGNDPGSDRAVRYVARLLGPKSPARVHLLHVLTPDDEGLPEDRGGESPELHRLSRTEIERQRMAWREKAEAAATPVVERHVNHLREAGVHVVELGRTFMVPLPEEVLADQILAGARELGCQTIVVGRSSLPFHKELTHRHVAEILVRNDQEHAIWVIP